MLMSLSDRICVFIGRCSVHLIWSFFCSVVHYGCRGGVSLRGQIADSAPLGPMFPSFGSVFDLYADELNRGFAAAHGHPSMTHTAMAGTASSAAGAPAVNADDAAWYRILVYVPARPP